MVVNAVNNQNQEKSNYGSALGEAVGRLVENEVHNILRAAVEEVGNGYTYANKGPLNPETGKFKQLRMKDEAGTEYSIDAVINNRNGNPVALIESKYIRYGKHNRDKGSWVCTAHFSLRRRYPTIRMSITVLVGNWSASSKALMKSFGIDIFEVPFSKVVEVLNGFGVDFTWGEKERDKAAVAWKRYTELTQEQTREIGRQLIDNIAAPMSASIKASLDDTIKREIKEVEVVVTSNLGEMKLYRHKDIQAASVAIGQLNADQIFTEENVGEEPTLTVKQD